MADLPETEDFSEGIYQIETSDRVIGGPGGTANKQAEQLGNRTAWLRAAIKKVIDGTTAVGKATKLATARTLRFKGAASGSGTYDGSADSEITLTLADSGVLADTYSKVQINAKGLVVSGSNPTTLAGYGITDALRVGVASQQYPVLAAPLPGGHEGIGNGGALQIREAQEVKATKTDLPYAPRIVFHWQGLIARDLAMSSVGDLLWGGNALWNTGNFNPATKANSTDVTSALASKANKATTLTGYGITDALRVGVASQQYPVVAAPLPGGMDGIGNGGALQIREAQEVGATKTDLSYAPRVLFHWQGLIAKDLAMSRFGDLLWGSNILWTAGNFNPDLKANKAEVDTALANKANKGTSLAAYNIGDAFTKDQVAAAIAAAIASLVNSAPGALDTLKELSDALGGDPNFATTILNRLGQKADTSTSLRIGSVSRQRPILSGNVPASLDSGGDGAGGAIELREVNEVGAGQTDLKYAPGILFHWSNKFSRYLKMSVLGDLIWGDKKVWTEGNFNPATKANTVDVTSALLLKANIADVLAAAAMTANGRLVIPTSSGPLYIQWYEGPLAGAEGVTYPAISHPVPFPTDCLFAGVFTRSTTGNTLSDQMFQMEYWDRLGVKVFPQWFGTGGQSLVKPLVIAIGR